LVADTHELIFEGASTAVTDVAQDMRRTAHAIGSGFRTLTSRHQHLLLAVAGCALAVTAVVSGGRVGPVRTTIPLSDWLGLVPRSHLGGSVAASVQLAALAGLVLLWLVAVRINRPRRCSETKVWWIFGAWAVPFAVGPPLLSADVYTYAAQGLMARTGIDVYHFGPAALGNVPAVAAVDPSWRSEPSPYGPLASLVQHLAIAISGGGPFGAVLVFRGLGVLSAIAIGILAADLAGPRRVQALTLTLLNPLVLVQIVSAAHLEGVMCALLLGSLVAADRQRWTLAILLAVASGGVKAPAYLCVLAVVAVHGTRGDGKILWRTALRDSAVAVVAFVGSCLVVPNGFGWLRTLTTPTLGHTALAPASLLADLFTPIVPAASFDDRSAGGRISALLAAACIVLYLTATANRRSLNRTVGYGLVAVALLSPVVYPWYLLWGVLCLAPTARRAHVDWLVFASGVACVVSPVGFDRVIGGYLSAAALAIAVVIITPRMLRRRAAGRQPTASVAPGPAPPARARS
jgi:hypothetical protein